MVIKNGRIFAKIPREILEMIHQRPNVDDAYSPANGYFL
jgi:hypothetical protein